MVGWGHREENTGRLPPCAAQEDGDFSIPPALAGEGWPWP